MTGKTNIFINSRPPRDIERQKFLQRFFGSIGSHVTIKGKYQEIDTYPFCYSKLDLEVTNCYNDKKSLRKINYLCKKESMIQN